MKPVGQFGNSGRNILSNPNNVTVNLAVGRIFALPESLGALEFRVEAFNAFNHPNFGTPSATIGSTTQAGVITSVGSARVVQLSGRYSF